MFRKNRLRYIGCILGFSMALGSVFTINSYTNMLDQMMDQFFLVDSDSVMVMSKGTTMAQFVPFNSKVQEELRTEVSQIYGVSTAIPLIFKDFSNVSSTDLIKDALVGIDFEYLKVIYLQDSTLSAGEWPEKNKNEVLVGSNVAGGNLEPGDEILIQNETFSVSGVLKPDNPLMDFFLYCEYSKIQEIYNMENYCSILYLLLDSEIIDPVVDTPSIVSQVESLSSSIHVMDSNSLKKETGSFFDVIKLIQAFLASFPFVISIMFVAILLTLNLKDNLKEFGILRAIGMPANKISLLIFIQVVFLTLVSYLGAILIGIVFFWYSYNAVIRFKLEYSNFIQFLSSMNDFITPSVYLNTFLITMLVGVLVSLIPILKWRKLNIVENFRKEE
ncbi:ABC transporter permease [Candidatus Lokiarchaeum ossiferum]